MDNPGRSRTTNAVVCVAAAAVLIVAQQVAMWSSFVGLIISMYCGWLATQYLWHGRRLRRALIGVPVA
jgi:hypothetical protein